MNRGHDFPAKTAGEGACVQCGAPAGPFSPATAPPAAPWPGCCSQTPPLPLRTSRTKTVSRSRLGKNRVVSLESPRTRVPRCSAMDVLRANTAQTRTQSRPPHSPPPRLGFFLTCARKASAAVCTWHAPVRSAAGGPQLLGGPRAGVSGGAWAGVAAQAVLFTKDHAKNPGVDCATAPSTPRQCASLGSATP